MLKLYKLTLSGIKTGQFNFKSSPGVCYAVADNPTAAYYAVINELGNDASLGDVMDFALDNIEVVASTEYANRTVEGLFKLFVDTTVEDVKPETKRGVKNEGRHKQTDK